LGWRGIQRKVSEKLHKHLKRMWDYGGEEEKEKRRGKNEVEEVPSLPIYNPTRSLPLTIDRFLEN